MNQSCVSIVRPSPPQNIPPSNTITDNNNTQRQTSSFTHATHPDASPGMMADHQQIANELYSGHALAPMVRASTIPLRALALQYGADFVYTEELVDRSISNTQRVVNEHLQTIDYVRHDPRASKKAKKRHKGGEGRPVLILRIDPKIEKDKLVCQLGTGEPELALQAARHVCNDVASIDINMGCPKKFSISGGMGSALLSDPDRSARIIKRLRAEIPRPISCKIRLLKDTKSTLEYIQAMVDAGVHSVAIHGRRVGDESTEPADWKSLQEVMGLARSKFPTLPILINGDFYDRDETARMMSKTGASGVLLARPALYNTSIFRPQSEPLEDKTTVVQEYVRQVARYDTNHKNAKYVICEMMSNRRTPKCRISSLPQHWPNRQTVAKICDCRSIEDICKVWDVNWSDMVASSSAASSSLSRSSYGKDGTVLNADGHKYDDSYLLQRLDNDPADAEQPTSKRPKSVA